MMTPDDAEAHAIAAKRQFEKLGRDASHIDPAKIRADAEVKYTAFNAEMSAPATRADIEELKRLILSMKPSQTIVNNISRPDILDAFSRTTYQVSKRLRALT